MLGELTVLFFYCVLLFQAGRKEKWRSNFLDSLRIHVQGGAGGMGQPKFGGVGGRGGRVFVEATEGKLSGLLLFNQKLLLKCAYHC